MMGYFGGNGDFGPLGWFGMGFAMLIHLGVAVLVIYFIIKLLSKDNYKNEPSSAIEVLRERYAKGEIDEEELKKRLEVLNKK